ncbi:MAG: FkbM family methyltransferase [Pseudomonadota bacterium]
MAETVRPASLEDAVGQPGFWKRLEKRLRRPATRRLRAVGAETTLTDAPWGRYRVSVGAERLIGLARRAPMLRSTVRAYAALRLVRETGGPVDAEYFGHRLRLYPARSESMRLMLLAPDQYQAEEFAFLAAHGGGEGVFLDIGANAGAYSFHAASLGRQVIAFEPDPFMVEALRLNLTFADAPAMTLERAALGEEAGEAAFSQETQSLAAGAAEMTQVETKRLVDVLSEHLIDRVAALKIDVEGFEDRVLIPFFREVPATLYPRAILIEHVASPLWREDVMAVLKALRYRAVFKNAHNTGLVRED